MYYLNLFIIISALLGLLLIIYFVVTKNKKIIVKGHDDFFTVIIVLFFVMVIFPIKLDATLLESFRNSLLYILLFSTFAVKRGISTDGIEKFCYTIKWNQIKEIRLVPYQVTKIHIEIQTDNKTYKLIFREYLIPKILDNLNGNISNIKIESSLQTKIEKGQFKKIR